MFCVNGRPSPLFPWSGLDGFDELSWVLRNAETCSARVLACPSPVRCLQRMLGGRTGDQGPNWALVGMVREPVSRYLSWFFYFSEPDSHLSVEQYARRGQGANGADPPSPVRPAGHADTLCS